MEKTLVFPSSSHSRRNGGGNRKQKPTCRNIFQRGGDKKFECNSKQFSVTFLLKMILDFEVLADLFATVWLEWLCDDLEKDLLLGGFSSALDRSKIQSSARETWNDGKESIWNDCIYCILKAVLLWTTELDLPISRFILEKFVTELDLYRSVAFLYSLYSLYITQLGFADDEDSMDDDSSQLPVVSIPIDLSKRFCEDRV